MVLIVKPWIAKLATMAQEKGKLKVAPIFKINGVKALQTGPKIGADWRKICSLDLLQLYQYS